MGPWCREVYLRHLVIPAPTRSELHWGGLKYFYEWLPGGGPCPDIAPTPSAVPDLIREWIRFERMRGRNNSGRNSRPAVAVWLTIKVAATEKNHTPGWQQLCLGVGERWCWLWKTSSSQQVSGRSMVAACNTPSSLTLLRNPLQLSFRLEKNNSFGLLGFWKEMQHFSGNSATLRVDFPCIKTRYIKMPLYFNFNVDTFSICKFHKGGCLPISKFVDGNVAIHFHFWKFIRCWKTGVFWGQVDNCCYMQDFIILLSQNLSFDSLGRNRQVCWLMLVVVGRAVISMQECWWVSL